MRQQARCIVRTGCLLLSRGELEQGRLAGLKANAQTGEGGLWEGKAAAQKQAMQQVTVW